MSVHPTLQTGLRIQGRLQVPPDSSVAGNIECTGSIDVADRASVRGDVSTQHELAVGQDVNIEGAVTARAGVTWSPGAIAGGLRTSGPLWLGDRLVAIHVEARNGVRASRDPEADA